MSKHTRFERWTGEVKAGSTLMTKRPPHRIVTVLAVEPPPSPGHGETSFVVEYLYGEAYVQGGHIRTLRRNTLAAGWVPVRLQSLAEAATQLKTVLKRNGSPLSIEGVTAFLIEQQVAVLQTVKGPRVFAHDIEKLEETMKPKVQSPKPESAKAATPAQLPLELPAVVTLSDAQMAELANRVTSTLTEFKVGTELAARLSRTIADHTVEQLLGDTRLVDVIARVVIAALDEGTASDDQRAQAFVEKVRAIVVKEGHKS